MENKISADIENIIRLREIANIYNLTNQKEKCEKYHKAIIRLCDRHPKCEKTLIFKMHSLNYLNKTYKSLEITNELLNIDPYNMNALINIARILKEGQANLKSIIPIQ